MLLYADAGRNGPTIGSMRIFNTMDEVKVYIRQKCIEQIREEIGGNERDFKWEWQQGIYDFRVYRMSSNEAPVLIATDVKNTQETDHINIMRDVLREHGFNYD